MNPHEAARVETLLELYEREVDDVIAPVDDSERELVFGHEVRDARDVEQGRALADARRDPFELACRRQLRGELARKRLHVRRGLTAEPLDLVERALQPID